MLDTPHPNRNDRCHCGSGKKYKRCCLPSDYPVKERENTISHVKAFKTRLPPDPNDNWAEVELYRWQTGVLPSQDPSANEQLDISKGIVAMADALEAGCKANGKGNIEEMPSPFNVCSVLRYAAKLLSERA